MWKSINYFSLMCNSSAYLHIIKCYLRFLVCKMHSVDSFRLLTSFLNQDLRRIKIKSFVLKQMMANKYNGYLRARQCVYAELFLLQNMLQKLWDRKGVMQWTMLISGQGRDKKLFLFSNAQFLWASSRFCVWGYKM